MKKDFSYGIVAIVVVLMLGFGFFYLYQDNEKRVEKFRIEKIRIDKQYKINDSIRKAKDKLESNACYFCKNQIKDKSYNIENDGTFKEYPNINGHHAMFCSIECCKEYLDKYSETHSQPSNSEPNDGGQLKLQEILDKEDENSNPNRTTCPQCSGSGYEPEGYICRMCHGSGKGHY